MKRLASKRIQEFQEHIYNYYKASGRALPWRQTDNPYCILVSEVMLQQTQVARVIPKYTEFINRFPTIDSLACSELSQILTVWSGLGYNRRALLLKQLAQRIVTDFNGSIPQDAAQLQSLPGIGLATACSICAFAFNQPVVFVETNIRSVYIHYFFVDQLTVDDDQILSVVGETLDRHNPREWYYALMDYGVFLKKQYPNPSRRSIHYIKQAPFAGSTREIRGKIVRILIEREQVTEAYLIRKLYVQEQQLADVLSQLYSEGLLRKKGRYITIHD